MELVENPGGIFWQEGELQWHFLYDTAISWLVPSFIYSLPLSAVAGALISVKYSRDNESL
ncbi:hypothetical protein [Paraferrimonas sp. SM1919]|uniref:hypothetical protein n=1 Tax=Paraferrimonas sp. SM1919 TaxID=2662263 RepID=UPI0013D50A1F|nr:hypothetical protein [Paraferrimonas sp. SM1919]